MKKLIVASMFAAAACAPMVGQASEDRINLWPLVGYDNGALDVIWPLGHFKDADEWRFFPIIKDRDMFGVFPAFWISRDSFAILPFYTKYDFSEGTLFPVVWWEFNDVRAKHTIFPLYYYHGREAATTFWAACGLAGYDTNYGDANHWLLPFYAKIDGDFYSIPFSRIYNGRAYKDGILCGMAGRSVSENGEGRAHWFYPFYYKDQGMFGSLPLRLDWNSDGEVTSWFSIPALSSGFKDGSTWKERYLLGLVGRDIDKNSGFRDSWCAPLYYANNQGTVVTPLYGQTSKAKWGLPGWYMDEHTFASPLWYSHTEDKNHIDQWLVPLLLSGGVYRDGVRKNGFLLNIAGNLKDDNGFSSSWCMPFYYANNQGTFVTPLYGQTGKSKWGLPGWYMNDQTFASPFWYGHTDSKGDLDQWMIPLLLSGGSYRDGVRKNAFLLNAAGYLKEDNGYAASWCMPFYYKNNDGIFITPLYGHNKSSQWCFPLWYSDAESLYSLPWCEKRNSEGDLESWKVPLLLSGGSSDSDGTHRANFLLGLGGVTWNDKNDKRSSWMFPFYYENSEGSFVTPLAGKSRDSSWVMPMFYTDQDSFVSLPYISERNEYEKSTTYVLPPLLSGCKKYDDGAQTLSAMVLYGHGSDAHGKTKFDYLFPLYHYNGKNGDFTSILYGRTAHGSHTNTWWATPLVGTRSGSKTGGWLFPFFNREKDASFEKDLGYLEAEVLPKELMESRERSFSSGIKGSVLLGSDHDHTIRGGRYEYDDSYRLFESSKQGNRIIYNHESDRRVFFDRNTGKRTKDEMESETMALCGLFYDKRSKDAMMNRSHARTRVLWKLWDREEEDGNVTVDAFPGFTYDSKTNGYSKTSFLWRFFRYEKDPKTGTKLDLLFLPIVR